MAKQNNQSKMRISAKAMRIILSLVLFMLLAGVGTGFYFVYLRVDALAQEVSTKQIEANSIDSRLVYLQGLERELALQQPNILKAKGIVSETQGYLYQNQIVSDLSRIANNAGVEIQSWNFTEQATAGGGETSGSGEAASTAPTEGAPAVSGQAQPTLNSVNISIQLSPDVEYRSFLKFISLIERNPTRMQILSISLTGSEKGAGFVNSQAMDIKVYVR